MIYEGVRARLLTREALVGLVGQRIYPLFAPQGAATPFMVYGEVGMESTPSHSHGGGGLSRTLFRLTIWSTSYSEARNIANMVRDILDGFKGAAGAGTITSCLRRDERDKLDLPQSGEEAPLYGREADYSIRYEETEPTLG